MKIEILNERFIDAIKEKIPQKTALANQLSEILCIEKEAVYRRLRGDVPFSFAEVATITYRLGISLDDLIGNIAEKSKPFHLKLVDFLHPTEEDYHMLEFMSKFSDSLTDHSKCEYGAAMNMIPLTLLAKYEYILRFYIYKWAYQNTSPMPTKTFSEVHPGEGVLERIKDFQRIVGKANRFFYIWDESIFQNVVRDILYFRAINLISEKEKESIKEELFALVDELESLAIKGKNELGNKILIYISNVSFETSYSYVEAPNLYLTMIMTFTLNQIASVDKVTFNRIRQFMQSLKRTSTLISESGEMYRIRFFESQRAILRTL